MARTTPVHSGYTIINGTTTGSNGSKCDTWIEYKITSQDTTNNRSTVQAYLYTCANFSSSTEYSGTANYGYLQVDGGTKQYLSISGYDFGNRTPVKFADHSFTINHNSDGTKQITLAGAWSTSHSSYISGGSVSATVTLTTIPRASSFSVSSGTKYLGTEMTITVTPASNTFYHKLKYALGSANTTVSLGQNTSYGLTVPLNDTWAGQLPSTTSGTLTLTLYTYSDSGYTTQVGSKASTLTINVPTSVKPTIGSMTISDVGGIVPSSWGVLVNGKSKIKAKLNNVAAGTGSTISSYTINIAGYSGSTNPFTASGYVTGDSDNNVSVNITGSATDARGRASSNVTQVETIYAYKAPVITVTDCYRSDSSGTRSEDGTYIRIRASRTCSSCNSKNSITAFQYRYRSSGGSWTSPANLTNNTGVTVNAGLSTTTAYEVEITATDALGTTSTKTVTIPSKEVLVNVNSSGSGLAVGSFSKTAGTFEVFYPFYLYDEAKAYDMMNSLVYKGILDSTVDIDDMHGAEYTGIYAIRSSMPINYPNTGWTWCYFIVISNGEVTQQYVFRPSTGFIARHWAGNPPHWYVWHYITTTHYAIGETFTFNVSFPLNGFVTSSTTGVRLALYLPKSASQVPVVRVTECSGTLRGISGYLNSDSSNHDFISDSTNYSVVATKVKDNLVTLQINKTSAYTNVTNNTPVSFYPNKLTLSFEDSSE